MASSRAAGAAALFLLLLPPPARANEAVLLKERAFPGGDGASAETLDQPLEELIRAFQLRTGRSSFRKRMVIHKSRRRLDLFADDTLVKSYLVELGPSSVGPKRSQGDMRTPEGDLFVCSMNRKSQFTRFLALAYPTPERVAAAVAKGEVPAQVEREVREAYRRRDHCPPQLTGLGGAVGIHGSGRWERRPEGFALVDWTFGCVALRDRDILELFDHYAEVGTPVHIEPD